MADKETKIPKEDDGGYDPLLMQLRAARRKVLTIDDAKDVDLIFNGTPVPRELPATVDDMPIQYHWIWKKRLLGEEDPHPRQDIMVPVNRDAFPDVPRHVFNYRGQFVARGTDVLMYYDKRVSDRLDNDLREERRKQLEAIGNNGPVMATEPGGRGTLTPGSPVESTSSYYKQLFADDVDAAAEMNSIMTVA